MLREAKMLERDTRHCKNDDHPEQVPQISDMVSNIQVTPLV